MKLKKLFVYIFIALLLITLVIVPLVGVDYYDSGSVLDLNSPVLSIGGGSRVNLKFDDDSLDLPKEDMDRAVASLKKRFETIGYTDTSVEALDDGSIQVEVAIKKFVKDSVQGLASKGVWTFTDLYQGNTVSLNASDFKEILPASGYVRIEFTADGLNKFNSGVASILYSGVPYLSFTVDDMTYGYIDLKNEFSGSYLYVRASDPSSVCAFLSSDPLPASMVVTSHEAIEPTSPAGLRIGLLVGCCVVCLVLLALLVVKGKLAGIFSVLAFIGDFLVFLVAFANYRFSLSYQGFIFVGIALLLIWAFYFYVNSEIGSELKKGRSLSGALSAKLKTVTMRGLILHGAVVFVGLLLLIFFSGAFALFLRAILWGAVANIVLYFLIFYLGVNAAAEGK